MYHHTSHGHLMCSVVTPRDDAAAVIAEVFLEEQLVLSGRQLLVRVAISGELSRETTLDVGLSLRGCREPGADLVLDLSGVTFIDAGGISALVEEWRTCRAESCDMIIVNPSRTVARLLAILRLDMLLARKPSRRTALRASLN